MKKIFILRHGEYRNDNGRYPLSDNGKRQVRELACLLKENIGDETSIRILSSVALRALQSADIIAAALGDIEYEQHELLWFDGDGHGKRDYEGVIELIRERDIEVVIVITHDPYVSSLPRPVAYEFFGAGVRFLSPGRGACVYAEGMLIDGDCRIYDYFPARN